MAKKQVSKGTITKLMNQLKKIGIDPNSIKGKDPHSLKGNALTSFVKIAKRKIERPKIVEEVKKINAKLNELNIKNNRKYRLSKVNDLIAKYPTYKNVLKYGKRLPGEDELAHAERHLKQTKENLYKEIIADFPDASSHYKKKIKDLINSTGKNLDLVYLFEDAITDYFQRYNDDIEDDLYLEPDMEDGSDALLEKLYGIMKREEKFYNFRRTKYQG